MITRILVVFALSLSMLHARVFTDDRGRNVEAELVGVRGKNVILSRGRFAGQWPKAKLAAEDQAYVRKWQENPPHCLAYHGSHLGA
jgi:hypothetical protein